MEFFQSLARMWHRPKFRRVLVLRIFSQGGDAVTQVAMASYLLLNPQNQPTGPAIAAVLAITLLPFCIVGPFVSPIIDHLPRRTVVIASDLTRIALTIAMAAVVGSGWTTGSGQAVLMVLLLLSLSINRLQLAALGAGLPYTIDDDEYLDATSILPIVGPIAATVGGLAAGAIRLTLGKIWTPNHADALIFMIAGLLFVGAVACCWPIARRGLGPEELADAEFGDVLSGLGKAARHLWERQPAFWSIAAVFAVKVCWGAALVTSVLIFRHHFHGPDTLDRAMIEMGAWFALAGVGFAASGVLASPLAARLGVWRTMIAALILASASQAVTAIWQTPLAFFLTAFPIGIFNQTVKVCADAVVQAHVDDQLRGRVMVLYDIFNNFGQVVGAVIAGFLLPLDGASPLAIAVIAAGYLLTAGIFSAATGAGRASFDRGTRANAAGPRGERVARRP